jgi:AcrR family transcriptional regulator
VSGKRRPRAIPATRGLRRGGRSARVVESVFAATHEELARTGYVRLSIEAVAERAGVAKSTIYRRWPTKATLVVATVTAALVVDARPQSTLREDLLSLARWLAAWVEAPEGWAVMRALIAEMNETEAQALNRAARHRLQEHWAAAVRRSIARGEIPAETDVSLVVEGTMAAVIDPIVHASHVVDDRFIDAIVNFVVIGALHGGGVPPSNAGAPTRRTRDRAPPTA